MGQPFYHLRPNKIIDRHLFIRTLLGLNKVINFPTYTYTGFGSYLFDDFKLVHDLLNISSMKSIEKDPDVYKRAKFNKPYDCIEIQQTTSSDYIGDLEISDDDHNIIWLDYASPKELGNQLEDFSTLLQKLNARDIVRITLNANPSSLGYKGYSPDNIQKLRADELGKRVGEYYKGSFSPDTVTGAQYPITLLKILKYISLDVLKESVYNTNFFFPIFSTIYADGQQMLTYTGIILDSHDDEKEIQNALKTAPYDINKPENPCRISIPELSAYEIMELNKLLPTSATLDTILTKYNFIFKVDEDDRENTQTKERIESYLSYYKFYPNFHHVIF